MKSPLPVGALIGVRAKVIALRLDQIGRQPAPAAGVEII